MRGKQKHARLRQVETARKSPDLKALADTPPWDWPENTAGTLLQVLKDPSASDADRLVAADLAGNMIVVNDAFADVLLGIVSNNNEPEQLRAQAAISLAPVLEHSDTVEFDDPFEIDEPSITERTFERIRLELQKLHSDASVPELVRRRILEASVRSPQDWHRDAILRAYSSGNRYWVLTAVFAMQYVRGFDNQIVEALESSDADIHYEAVCAAGNWSVDGAWDHVVGLVQDRATPKPLKLAAIAAVGSIRPQEAREILEDLADSRDEEIAEAAEEALVMAEGAADFDDEEEEGEFF